MNAHQLLSPANEFSADAAHMPGMTTSSLSSFASNALRHATVDPNYDRTHERVNSLAREIATHTLEITGGRTTYSWEGNGIRIAYAGDIVRSEGTVYGETAREYLVGDEYKRHAPVPSQSGTGMMNLQLDHVKGCIDPVVEAKRQIIWLLLDPDLELVDYVIRTTTAWHGLMQTPHKLRTALAIRLAELIEQKVLENPSAGLDLRDLAKGVNVVGWMVKTLDGSIFNLMKRVTINESKQNTTLDTPVDDDAYRRPVAELAAEQLPQSAEADAMDREADERAFAFLERMHAEEQVIADAKALNAAAAERGEKKQVTIRARRTQEKTAIIARTFLAQTGLPSPVVPDVETRKAMVEEMVAEEEAYRALVLEAEQTAATESELTGEKVTAEPVVRERSIALRSFMAWFNRLNAHVDPRDSEVSATWLRIWRSYNADQVETMLEAITGHEERLTKVVEGVLAVPEKMSTATKKRIMDAMMVDEAHTELNQLMVSAVNAYDQHIQGEKDYYEWEEVAFSVLEHEHGPKMRTVEELAAAFDAAASALVF